MVITSRKSSVKIDQLPSDLNQGGTNEVANNYYNSQVDKDEALEGIVKCFQNVIGSGPQFDYLD